MQKEKKDFIALINCKMKISKDVDVTIMYVWMQIEKYYILS